MRAASIVVAAVAVSAAAAAPEITPPLRISRGDVREICWAVGQVTSHPVRSISPASSDHYVPGAIAAYASFTTNKGFQRVKIFLRTDRVIVRTGSKRATSGDVYEVQKSAGKWKVLPEKGSWIE